MPLLEIISAAAPAIGGAIQGALGYRGQKKTNEANMEMAKYAYSKDLEMWNRQNVYNSPEAQMQRLKSAGLNPNLVYGQGAVANTSGQMPKYNAPTLDYNYVPPVGDTLGSTLAMYQDFQIKQAQTNNLREQNKVIRESALQKNWLNRFSETTFLPRELKSWEDLYDKHHAFKLKEMQLQQGREMFPYQMEYQKGKINVQSRQYEKMLLDMNKLDTQIEYQQKVNEWYLTKMFSQLGLQAFGKITDLFPQKAATKALGTFNQKKRNVPTSKAFEETTRRMQQFGKNN